LAALHEEVLVLPTPPPAMSTLVALPTPEPLRSLSPLTPLDTPEPLQKQVTQANPSVPPKSPRKRQLPSSRGKKPYSKAKVPKNAKEVTEQEANEICRGASQVELYYELD